MDRMPCYLTILLLRTVILCTSLSVTVCICTFMALADVISTSPEEKRATIEYCDGLAHLHPETLVIFKNSESKDSLDLFINESCKGETLSADGNKCKTCENMGLPISIEALRTTLVAINRRLGTREYLARKIETLQSNRQKIANMTAHLVEIFEEFSNKQEALARLFQLTMDGDSRILAADAKRMFANASPGADADAIVVALQDIETERAREAARTELQHCRTEQAAIEAASNVEIQTKCGGCSARLKINGEQGAACFARNDRQCWFSLGDEGNALTASYNAAAAEVSKKYMEITQNKLNECSILKDQKDRRARKISDETNEIIRKHLPTIQGPLAAFIGRGLAEKIIDWGKNSTLITPIGSIVARHGFEVFTLSPDGRLVDSLQVIGAYLEEAKGGVELNTAPKLAELNKLITQAKGISDDISKACKRTQLPGEENTL